MGRVMNGVGKVYRVRFLADRRRLTLSIAESHFFDPPLSLVEGAYRVVCRFDWSVD
jgi:hypothetical protein